MNLFTHDDAIILGWLCGNLFLAPKNTALSGCWYNYYSYYLGRDTFEHVSYGSGDYPKGENGKPAYATHSTGDLIGIGGDQNQGGEGFNYGLFGFGGNGGGYTSSGGGGGFFGGGSSYVRAGGGGGSSFNWLGQETPELIPELLNIYMQNVPQYMLDNYGITDYDINLYKGTGTLGVDIIHIANYNFGNGWLKITSKQTGVEIPFDFQYGTQTYRIPETGLYTFEGCGAQGGGGSSRQDITDKEVGGCGAYNKCTFYLRKDTILYIVIGQYGGQIRSPVRPQGNGGGAASYRGYAGGGATSVFLIPNDMTSRLYVAGGGGGAGAGQGSNDPLEPIGRQSHIPFDDNNKQKKEEDDGEDSIITDKQMFIISDLSIAYVDLTYNCSNDITENEKIIVDLYVDDVYRGTQEVNATKGGGFNRFTFDNFDTWLPEGTTPYWATIQAIIRTDLPQMIIPQGGIIITVITKTRENDKNALIQNIFGLFGDLLNFTDFIKVFLQEVGGGLEDLLYLYNNENLTDYIKIRLQIVEKWLKNINQSVTLRDYVKLLFIDKSKLSINELTKIKLSAFAKIKFKTISKLYCNIVDNLILNGYFQEVKDPGGDFSTLQYLTNQISYNNYATVFFKQVTKNKVNITDNLRINDYNKLNIESPPSNTKNILSTNIFNSFIKFTLNTISKIVNNISDTSLLSSFIKIQFNSNSDDMYQKIKDYNILTDFVRVDLKTVTKNKINVIDTITTNAYINIEED